MTRFDFPEVAKYIADLETRMDQCDNGEGMECANIEKTLQQYAFSCCNYCQTVRQWMKAVFVGKVAFDPQVEEAFRREGNLLLGRTLDLLEYGKTSESECFELAGLGVLRFVALQLNYL